MDGRQGRVPCGRNEQVSADKTTGGASRFSYTRDALQENLMDFMMRGLEIGPYAPQDA